MKTPTLILAAALITISSAAEMDLGWVDKQIQAIKPKRVGIEDSYIANLQNPILLKRVEEVEKPPETEPVYDLNATTSAPDKPLKLFAILNNSALINGQWYKEHDEVRGYTLTRVGSDNVVLSDKEGKLKLFLTEEKDKIKIEVR